jgi:tetraacyldisaccharide 4'-kinase
MHSRWVRRVWERKGLFGTVLWIFALPLSLLYGIGACVRNLLYTWCIPARNLPCAVVSVGNLTVGGTGKTPTTLWLARELGQRGYKVAILSRGYKRSGKGPIVLEPPEGKPVSFKQAQELPDAGDEPIMMARLFGQRVVVGKRRYQAASLLLRSADVDVFILDDGFQHRRLKRDLDLLLLGANWKGWLLPAGPFREPKSSLRRANLFLVTGEQEKWKSLLAGRPRETIFSGSLQPQCLLTLDGDQWKEQPLAVLDKSKILTVSAIANPLPLYRMIHDWGGEIGDVIELPDHHSYSSKDWQRINRVGRNMDLIITTEKDLLKLLRFPFARGKLLALRVAMVVENGNLLIDAVAKVVQGKRKGA